MAERRLVLFLDSGDTIIDEGTEIKGERGVVLKACPWPGAPETLRRLKEMGFRLCMVADGFIQSFETVYHQLGLYDLFEQRIYSEAVGREKPDAAMFEAALAQNGPGQGGLPKDIDGGQQPVPGYQRSQRHGHALGLYRSIAALSPGEPGIPRRSRIYHS